MTSKLTQTAIYILAIPFVFVFGFVVFAASALVSTGSGLRRIWTNAR